MLSGNCNCVLKRQALRCVTGYFPVRSEEITVFKRLQKTKGERLPIENGKHILIQDQQKKGTDENEDE